MLIIFWGSVRYGAVRFDAVRCSAECLFKNHKVQCGVGIRSTSVSYGAVGRASHNKNRCVPEVYTVAAPYKAHFRFESL